jgi:hypothetical protein
MNLYCINCKWFKDGAFSRVYITPRCTVLADDDHAMWMRANLCGLDGKLFEAKIAVGAKEEVKL